MHSDDILYKVLESLYAANTQNTGLPRLPKALATSMPTSNEKTEKFEHCEDFFQTSLKFHPHITEQEKIHYFHSLLRGDALQTFCNMTGATKSNLSYIIASFRRRYVKTQLVATARCKWEDLAFNPASQTFQDILELHKRLAREAYADEAPKFIGTSFYAKMSVHLKKSRTKLASKRLTTKQCWNTSKEKCSYTDKSTSKSTLIKGIHNIEPVSNTNQEKNTKRHRTRLWLRPPRSSFL